MQSDEECDIAESSVSSGLGPLDGKGSFKNASHDTVSLIHVCSGATKNGNSTIRSCQGHASSDHPNPTYSGRHPADAALRQKNWRRTKPQGGE